MSTKKTVPFRDQIVALEEIARWFDRGDVDIDEGLKKYEQGLALAAECKKRLLRAEQVVVELQKQYDAEEDSSPSSLL